MREDVISIPRGTQCDCCGKRATQRCENALCGRWVCDEDAIFRLEGTRRVPVGCKKCRPEVGTSSGARIR